jgi:hypothetical protein
MRSGRRGSNSRPLPWQGTFSNSYSQRADTGLPTCTYPQFPRGSTPNTRASTLTTRGPAPMTTSGNCPRRRPAAGRPGPREPGPRACIDGDEPYHTAPQLAIERSSWTDRLPKPPCLPARLIAAGEAIPLGGVQAMHAGSRRARPPATQADASERKGRAHWSRLAPSPPAAADEQHAAGNIAHGGGLPIAPPASYAWAVQCLLLANRFG